MSRASLTLRIVAIVVGAAYAAYSHVSLSDALVAVSAFAAGVSVPTPGVQQLAERADTPPASASEDDPADQ
jgi:hypothetical protein